MTRSGAFPPLDDDVAFSIECGPKEILTMPHIIAHYLPELDEPERSFLGQLTATSIADGRDFVGLCINIASRLQKLADGAFSFAFTQKGLEPEVGIGWYEGWDFKLIKIPIRGVAKDELIYVPNSEFRKLSKALKRAYRP